jgi:hypothetical protein
MNKRGPQTEAGKNAVRLNAAKHAILSLSPVIPGVEREEDWLAHRDGVIESLRPEGYLELSLAERVALNLWRLNRAARFESETIAIDQDSIKEDFVPSPRFDLPGRLREVAHGRDPLVDLEDEVRMASETENVLRAFAQLEDDAEVSETMAETVLEALALYVGADLDELLNGIKVPEGITAVQELKGIIGILSVGHAESAMALVWEYLIVASSKTAENQQEIAKLKEKRQRARSLRLLPGVENLAKIQRYEAHLHRQMIQTMHELEALQSRRRGEPTPLARIDVQGAPEG